jgi:histidine decarboxylase
MRAPPALKAEISRRLSKFRRQLAKASQTFLGYPMNLICDYEELYGFFDFKINNVGDPFSTSNAKLDSKPFEREVLRFFAELYRLPKEEFWGYVTTGGTEGNLYGLFLARELYPDGILYYSEDTHYSVQKAARLLKMKHTVVKSLENGEVDYDELAERVRANRDRPAILNLNIGTTMKGAVDNLDRVLEILHDCKVEFYIHCDAALFGMILPFVGYPVKLDFERPIGSLAVSGHKFIGSPVPCGVVLTRKRYVRRIEREVEYAGVMDTTVTGSRSGHAPLILWYAINMRGLEGFRREAKRCLNNARYLHERLREMGYPSMRNDYSNIVVFKKPAERVVKKWQLATQGDYAHIVVMQHVTKSLIDKFVEDLERINE